MPLFIDCSVQSTSSESAIGSSLLAFPSLAIEKGLVFPPTFTSIEKQDFSIEESSDEKQKNKI